MPWMYSKTASTKEPQKNPVLRNAKPSDGLLGRGQIPHETGCCVPYDGTGRSRLYAARYRNAHTRVTNILPLFLSILGANFSLFLRFKGPASKGTGIDPRARPQGPSFKKTRSDTGPCARPLKKTICFETLNLRQGPLAASLHPLHALLIPRLSNRPPNHLPLPPFPLRPTPPACPTHPWPRKTAPTVSMLSVTGRPPESEASV